MKKSKIEVNPGPFVLASILTAYPDENFQESLENLLDDESMFLPKGLRERLQMLAGDILSTQDLRSEYIAIFDLAKSLSPLYETEYGRERSMFKAAELTDIAGFYRAFGFDMNQESARDMVDHVSVELEFYSLLLMKYIYLEESGDQNGCEVVMDGMRKFMTSHLGRFVDAITEREGVKQSETYREIFAWANEIIAEECLKIGAFPEKATWLNSQGELENMCCGGTVGIEG